MSRFEKGQFVSWQGGGRQNRGRVVDIYIEEITRTIEDTEYHMTPTIDAPAYLIEQDDGSEYILAHDQLSLSSDQDMPVETDTNTRMNEKKHTY